MTDPESLLMKRVQRDEPEAFADLVRRFRGPVFARLYRDLGDRQEAEDLTQEVFLRLFRSRKRYLPRARVSTWVFFIAQNAARNALRTRRRRLSWLRLGFVESAQRALPWRSLTDLERFELAQTVRQALTTLLAPQQRALEMQQFQDRSYAEIAAALDLSQSAAKSLLYRARVQLREILSDAI